jgi:antitoxin PrlF
MPTRKTATSKITSKGQVTIPEVIREALHLRTGDQIEWQVEDLTAHVRKRTGNIEDLAGLLARPGQPSSSVEQMDEAVGELLARKHGRRR